MPEPRPFPPPWSIEDFVGVPLKTANQIVADRRFPLRARFACDASPK